MIWPEVVEDDSVRIEVERLARELYAEGEIADAPPSELQERCEGAVGRDLTAPETERAVDFWHLHVCEVEEGVGLGYYAACELFVRRKQAAGKKSLTKALQKEFAVLVEEADDLAVGYRGPLDEGADGQRAEWLRQAWARAKRTDWTEQIGRVARVEAARCGPGQTQDDFVPPAARGALRKLLDRDPAAHELAQFCAVYREALAEGAAAASEPAERDLVEAPEGWRELGRMAGDITVALGELEREKKAVNARLAERKATLTKQQALVGRALRVMAAGPYLVERASGGQIVVVHGEQGDRVELVEPGPDADGRQLWVPGTEPVQSEEKEGEG